MKYHNISRKKLEEFAKECHVSYEQGRSRQTLQEYLTRTSGFTYGDDIVIEKERFAYLRNILLEISVVSKEEERATLTKYGFTKESLKKAFDAIKEMITDLSGATLDCVNLVDVRGFVGAKFVGARLKNSNFQKVNFMRADFSGAYLSGADFLIGDLEDAKFSGAYLFRANFLGANICGADFSNSIIVLGKMGYLINGFESEYHAGAKFDNCIMIGESSNDQSVMDDIIKNTGSENVITSISKLREEMKRTTSASVLRRHNPKYLAEFLMELILGTKIKISKNALKEISQFRTNLISMELLQEVIIESRALFLEKCDWIGSGQDGILEYMGGSFEDKLIGSGVDVELAQGYRAHYITADTAVVRESFDELVGAKSQRFANKEQIQAVISHEKPSVFIGDPKFEEMKKDGWEII